MRCEACGDLIGEAAYAGIPESGLPYTENGLDALECGCGQERTATPAGSGIPARIWYRGVEYDVATDELPEYLERWVAERRAA